MENNPTFHERNRPMFRSPRLLPLAALMLISMLPVAAQAAPLGRVPLNDSAASFNGYYGYDGKYHYPAGYGNSTVAIGAGGRSSGSSTFGYGSGHHHHGR
jgi:hypothetical protein